LKDQARVVVIGGGINGCSVLYHLAKAGWTDVVLIEKGELTSGATCHAAGTLTQFNTSPTIMRMRKYSLELYGRLNIYDRVGSLRIASDAEQFKTIQRDISKARGIGLAVEMISPGEAAKILPWMSGKDLYGGFFLPDDGCLDPHLATHAIARAAKDMGAEIYTDTRVTGIELNSGKEIERVTTSRGDIRCEHVVNAAGIWGAQIASMAGISIPSTPVIHQHIALEGVSGHEVPGDSPIFRDYGKLVYCRPEGGGYLVGGWEADPPACWVDGVPWEHGGSDVPGDFDRFTPMLEDTIARFPFLADAGIIRLVAHPDAFSPDSGPLLGPWPGLKGFWLACASSMQGFGGGGGIGKTMAEWMIDGKTEWDVYKYRAWRFGRHYADPRYAAECARECYKYYYRTRYPGDEDTAARPRRISPFHHRLQDLGVVFGTKNGWERANYFETDKPWRRAGEEQREYGGWVKPPFFDAVEKEHRAIRQRVGMVDMTSFGKIDLMGPGALPLLQRIADGNLDRPPGSVTYTQFLNDQGGMVGDVMVTRLSDHHFRIVSGSAFIDSDLGWIRSHLNGDGASVDILDTTEDYAVIGMWGPHSRAVLQAATADDVSNGKFPYMTARTITVNGVNVWTQRITYVGELGWEFYIPASLALGVWDAFWKAGGPYGMVACGYKAVDSLRLEKGNRAFNSDLTASETPYEAGLDFCVKPGKGVDFIGRKALSRIKENGIQQRLCTMVIGNSDYLTLYGGEAVVKAGKVVGRLRSAGYGHFIRKNIGYAYLPVDLTPEGTVLEVDIFGEMVTARVSPDALYDPEGKTIRC